ncbi:DUF937 domain-containing protein [Rivibacter subsaxonicus]|uniref:Uncharacterized protein DUF937 n=1 Tax=Rivibacter subsaxonicus TaxID=457575 RepID=A0A4Q7W2Q1_9BURK|nr:DUF937 domain-containing protein [Rivibacter subsaxonicus]RZU02989.1 uncharacterized protein DUF937 [Rivibacter subsaxonicus]
MATLLESLSQSLTPDVLGKLGGAVGLDANQVGAGLGVIGPLLTGSMAKNPAMASGGLDGLLGMLPKEGGGGLLGMLTGGGLAALGGLFGGGGATGAGGSMLSGILGPGVGAIGSSLDRALGFKVSPLLMMAAPVVLRAIQKFMAEKNVDSGTLVKQMQQEHAGFISQGGEQARIVEQAMLAGDEAAALKARFTAEQWAALRVAPFAAGRLVMLSDSSGPVGSVQEMGATASALVGAVKEADPASLLAMVFDSTPELDELKAIGNDKAPLLELLKRAHGAVAQHAPAQAGGYARLLVEVATKTAAASTEGGFLGIGGVKVSESEQAAINEIKALGPVNATGGIA